MKEEEFKREICKENLQRPEFKGSRIEYIVSEGNLWIFKRKQEIELWRER